MRISCGVAAGALLGAVLFTVHPASLWNVPRHDGVSITAAPYPIAKPGDAYGKLPVVFEANQGQADPAVRFIAHGPGYTLFLTDTDATLALRGSGAAVPVLAAAVTTRSEPAGRASTTKGTVVRLKPLAPNLQPLISGLDPLPGRVNYFIGNDPAAWRTDVPTYSRVVYRNLYPGIDMVYHGANGALEQDFLVAPGADTAAIGLGFAGVDKMDVDAGGDLLLKLSEGHFRIERPHLYQEAGGIRQEVVGGYRLRGSSELGFQVGVYDHSRPLVIDPVIAYSTFLGGIDNDSGQGIAVDGSGNAYVTGYTHSVNFPILGAVQPTLGHGYGVAFVSKLNGAGSALVYSTYLGGNVGDGANAIAVDGSGNAYLTGRTWSADFPTTPGAFQRTTGDAGGTWGDAFVAKLNAAGSGLVFSTYLGGSAHDEGKGIAVDGSGNVYVTGPTNSPDFPTKVPLQPNYGGGSFLSKINPAGSALVYSTYLGGTGAYANGIAVDGSGNAYVTGAGAFVAKVNPTGSALVYSTSLDGTGNGAGNGIAVDGSGNAYVTGHFQGAFVAKLNAAGSALIYSYPGAYEGSAIAVDGSGQALITGSAVPSNLLSAPFVAKLNAAGSDLVYLTYLRANSFAYGYAIAVDGSGSPYVTGATYCDVYTGGGNYYGCSFPSTQGALQTTFLGGAIDAFVTKLLEVPGAVQNSSYHLDTANDGAFTSWVEIDPTLRVTEAPASDAAAVVSANIDLWTTQAGYNQDVGIFVSADSGPDMLVAWKESGGFAGTYSPNAALAHAVVPVLAGHNYVFKMKWKPNKAAPGQTIYAGAGTATSQFSPTRLAVRLVPAALVYSAVQSNSYHLDTANDGSLSSWVAVDPALDLMVPGAETTVLASANMDLWTSATGFNQDLGVFVAIDSGPDLLLAWKESGGFAGTLSPNAAFVSATYATHLGHRYTFRLKWKPNKAAPGGTLYGGAGTAATQFSPTRLTVEQMAPGKFQSATNNASYHLDGANQGAFWSWLELDTAGRVTITSGASSVAVATGNIDLWTAVAGYDQDIAIFSCDWSTFDCSQFGNYVMIGWKESGGYAGTLSPNAATVQAMLSLTAGHAYTFTLGWKANKPAPGGVIYAGAGTAETQFSPTTLVVQLGG